MAPPPRNKATKVELLVHLELLEQKVIRRDWRILRNWFAHEDETDLGDILTAGAGGAFSARRRSSKVPESQIRVDDNNQIQVDASKAPIPKECSICMEESNADDFPNSNLTDACKHEPNACGRCIRRSIDSQIPDVQWNQVTCPECEATLAFDTVKEWASEEAFQRYDRKALNSAFSEIPNFTMCLGSNCNSGQIHTGGEAEPIMTCATCKFQTCFTHKMPWHTGQTCEQYDADRQERIKQEELSEQYLQSKAKVCPNPKCGLNVTKISGCDHITCHHCHHQYCWLCQAPYSAIRRLGNSAHQRTCRYWA